MTRKLVHIEKVKSIEPIAGADNIELAKVLSWQVVVKRGEVTPGSIVALFEIDSFLPIEDRYEFLRASSYRNNEVGEGFRLHTVKLRKTLSQGLALPLSFFPELEQTEMTEGQDLTDILHVKLYEEPEPVNMHGMIAGKVSSMFPVTEQERIQNIYDVAKDMFRDVSFEVTEKINGTSDSNYLRDDKFGVAGHHMRYKEGSDNLYWQVARDIDMEGALRSVGRNIAVQGEAAGSKIQKNPLRIKGHRWFMFDVYDFDEHRYLTPAERLEVYDLLHDYSPLIEHVPVIEPVAYPFLSSESVDDILKKADGKSLICPDAAREGIVYKANEIVGGIIPSFKVLSNALLLKEEKAEPLIKEDIMALDGSEPDGKKDHLDI